MVLGFIGNETRRFYVYVSNRVDRIRKSSTPQQWHYVRTDRNPADLATRSVDAQDLESSMWHTRPEFFFRQDGLTNTDTPYEPPEIAQDDPEIRPVVKTLATKILQNKFLGTRRFSKFSQWGCLVKAIGRLILL